MKTFLLALASCTLAALTSYGQTSPADSTTTESLKPQAKHVATELNVNPFNGSLSLNNSINQLKFRFFTAPNFAVRVGFNGSRKSDFSENTNPYGTNSYRYENERSSTTIGLNIGVEKHFAGTKRLSPYIGADIAVENKSTEHKITEGQSETTITGAWRETSYYNGNPSYPGNPSYYVNTYSERGYFRYGVNVVSGFDFYMAKNFFFGYEVNFGFSNKTLQELEIKQSDSNSTPADNREVKDSSFSFGPNLMNGVRVGYVF